MKKITFLAALFAVVSIQAQTVLFEDDFESYDDFLIANVGDWTLIDVDQLPTYAYNEYEWENNFQPMAFMVFNSSATTPPLLATDDADWDAHSGDKAMTSFASVVTADQPNNDDWLISPEINLGSSGNVLTFWAKATDALYGDEKFNVGISTTGTDPSGFIMIAEELTPTEIEWEEFTFNLDDYAGLPVHIAINHVAADQFGFQVDDFKVVAGALSVDDVAFQEFNHFIANGQLNLSASRAMENVSVYNALGQIIVSKSLSSNTESVDISSFSTGVYVVTVTIDGANKTFRVLKN